MLWKALQAVIPATNDDVLRARVARHRSAIVEHLVARLDDKEVALRRDVRYVERFPLAKVRFGELIRLAGMKVLLRAEVGAQADVRIDRRIDEHRA